MILVVLAPRFRSWFKASKIYVGRIGVAWDCTLSNWLLLECFVLPSLFASFKYSSILTCLCDSVRVNSNVWHLTKRQSSQLKLHCGPAGAVAWTSLHDIRMVRVALMWGRFAFWTITRWPTVWELEKFKACTAARRAVLHSLHIISYMKIWVREHVDLRICTLHFSAWEVFFNVLSWEAILNCRALWHHRRLQVQKRANNKRLQAAASSYTKATKNMKQRSTCP